MRWLRWIGYALLVLAVIGAGAYYWLFVDSSAPSSGEYKIDMAEVRRLASSVEGEKPAEIRFEHVASFKFPLTVAIAGESWETVDVPVFSYQLVYPATTLVIDTGVSAAEAKKSDSQITFLPDAHARMEKAMETASWIVITHEHPDHIGGIIGHPNLPVIQTRVKLTREQLDHPEKMFGLQWPPGAKDFLEALEYEKYHAIAPGVVLIKAPGHTPGSQLVFVQRADGREYLFLGDVAWRFENVERVRTRARLVSTYLIEEDRDAVMRQLAELKRIRDSEPNLVIVPGHDVKHHAEVVNAGALVAGFK